MVKKHIKSIAVIFIVTFMIFPRRDQSRVITFDHLPEKNLSNINTLTGDNGRNAYRIADLTYQGSRYSLKSDVVLSFNYPATRLLRDDTRNYRIKYSEYIHSSTGGTMGSGSAKFFKSDHRVVIQTVQNLWLGRCGDLGSFSIEFRFKPIKVKDDSVLFSRIGYLSGRKKGIEVVIKNGKAVAALYGILKRPDGITGDVFLKNGSNIKRGKWHHFVLSYDRISGKLAKYLNGMEDDSENMTVSGNPYNGVYVPHFGSMDDAGEYKCISYPDAVIGRNFSGYIDEFRISHRDYDDLKKETDIAYSNYKELGLIQRIPFNNEGIVTSSVYSFKGTGTKVTLFNWKEILKRDTFIWMEFRISDRLFYEDDIELKWYRIKNLQRNIFIKKDENGDFLRGKYYQWRAHLIASPDGLNSPVLSDVRLRYRPDPSPNQPLFIQITGAGDQYVKIKWKKNVDSDIFGYRIYYGVKGSKYNGILSVYKSKRITNRMSKSNYIELRITNRVIEENRRLDRRNLLSFPIIRNNVLYFFSVSAYDSYKPDTAFNHESDLSKQVSARPFAGSDIDQ